MTIRSRRLLASLALAVTVGLAACAPAPSQLSGTAALESSGGVTPVSAPAAGGTIAMRDYSFQPANIEVKVGTKVTWRNDDSAQHTVTADGGLFSSRPIDGGGTFSYTFDKAGTYTYHCSIHRAMVGQVVVK